MITCELYPAMGLGNQLWQYAVCRTIAADEGYEFGIQSSRRFKGKSFLRLDFGQPVHGPSSRSFSPVLPRGIETYFPERHMRNPRTNQLIPFFDRRLTTINDNTKIDGYFQAERYIMHRKQEIADWFRVDIPTSMPSNTCIVSIRGGDYLRQPGLALGRRYYQNAMAAMQRHNADVKFMIITDDYRHARQLLPHTDIAPARSLGVLNRWQRHPGKRQMAEHLALLQQAPMIILANSSFAWWGAWTNVSRPYVIAPKYWVAHTASDGYWHAADSLTSDWFWMDQHGRVSSSQVCEREFAQYRAKHGWPEAD